MRPLIKTICYIFSCDDYGGEMTVSYDNIGGNSATAQPSGGAGANTIS